MNRAYVVNGSACLWAFFSNSTNLLVPAGSYFGVLNLRIGCRSGLTKVSFDNPRHEIYGGTNNSVFYFCPKCSLFLCSVTYNITPVSCSFSFGIDHSFISTIMITLRLMKFLQF